ncbi:MAG: hypothetical protein B6226_03900 [Candidatus Cloacimonetes bacterium 4572_65]|nr:MAG: hypothetical protein B6226_03900 [Candidatus Cloacimonetes bacterium 4572_65]
MNKIFKNLLVFLILSISLVALAKTGVALSNLEVSPNPMEKFTTVSFDFVGEASLSVRIIDKDGHTVVTLGEGLFTEGSYSYNWDRVDNEGRIVPSGKYIVVVDSTTRFVTKRKTLILK